MIKTLLVDDDFLVRMYLKQLINWEEEGFTLVGDACNGKEALEIINRENPELVITDLNMPFMDGIELIKTIKKDNICSSIVVLSCHDDFEYVKEAMKLGADEYVLKNVLDANSLKKLLNDMKACIQQASKRELLQMLSEKGSDILKQETITYLKETALPYNLQLKKMNDSNIDGQYYQCSAVIIKVLDKIKYNATIEVLNQLVRDKKACCIKYSKDEILVLYDLTGISSIAVATEQTRMLVTSLLHTIKDYVNIIPFVGVSSIIIGDGSITYALRQAENALLYCFYGQSVCYHGEVQEFTQVADKIAEKYIEVFRNALYSEEMIITGFYNLIEQFKKENTNPNIVKTIIDKLDTITGAELTPIITIDDCMNRVEEYKGFIKTKQSKNVLKTDNMAVHEAAEYIRNNYNKQISLNELAEMVCLSPAYLSYVFKKETGVNFSDYLLCCRLEHVKRNLKSSTHNIKDIAEQAGFYDYRHFCKIFKKEIGMRPADFRKQS